MEVGRSDFSTVKLALMGPAKWKSGYLRGGSQGGSLLTGCFRIQVLGVEVQCEPGIEAVSVH